MSAKKKVVTSKKHSKTPIKVPTLRERFTSAFMSLRGRIKNFKKRRPHASFRRTLRRDYARPLKLPGYWAFTNEVRALLWKNKKLFLLFVLVYAVLTAFIVGIASQATYAEYTDALKESGSKLFGGEWWQVGQAGILLSAGVLGSLNETPGSVERLVALFLGIMIWLTTVWLLRAILAGKKPRLRDGIYSAGAPVISTLLVFAVAIIQLLPVALAAIAYGAASASGLITEGIESMVFWAFEILLLTLSVYWMSSTFFALIIITLPGMYPMQAFKAAGDLVIGRRVRILLRFLWLFFLLFIVWSVVMIPLIFFDAWLKSVWPAIANVPIVPVALLLVASLSIIWMSAYTYLFYRKVVDDGAAPA